MKKLSKITALTIALGLTLTLGACSTPTPAPTTPDASQAPTASANPSQSAEEAIVERYEDFLAQTYAIDAGKIAAFGETYSEVLSEPTEGQKGEIINSMLEVLPALAYLDTEGLDIDEVGAAYGMVIGLGTIASGADLKVSVPVESVTVTGETATVDITQLVITIDSVEANSSESAGDPITFNLRDGEWLIDPSGLSV